IQLYFGEQQPGACYFVKSLDQRLKERLPVTLEQNTARIPGEDYTCLFERMGGVPEAAVLKDEKEKEGSYFVVMTNIKPKMLERTVTQIQEIATEEVPEEPPPYGFYPIQPGAGNQDPVRVEFEEGETEVKEAEKLPR
ncbi:hypothetical protein NDU88_004595, partial [Pleurodeles waltl]